MTGNLSQSPVRVDAYPHLCPKCGARLGPSNEDRMDHFGSRHADALGSAVVRGDPVQEPREFVYVAPAYGESDRWAVVWWGGAEVVKMRPSLYEIRWLRKPPEGA